ncbi:MAG: hypothetical protein ACLFP4_12975 [Spirochaetales bacterium]
MDHKSKRVEISEYVAIVHVLEISILNVFRRFFDTAKNGILILIQAETSLLGVTMLEGLCS